MPPQKAVLHLALRPREYNFLRTLCMHIERSLSERFHLCGIYKKSEFGRDLLWEKCIRSPSQLDISSFKILMTSKLFTLDRLGRIFFLHANKVPVFFYVYSRHVRLFSPAVTNSIVLERVLHTRVDVCNFWKVYTHIIEYFGLQMLK